MAADLLLTLGRVSDAVRILREVVALRPDYYPAHSRLLLASLYHGTGVSSYRTHAAWGRLIPATPPTATPVSSGRIRIGYLSSAFRTDPEAFFTMPLVSGHNREQFEVFCYAAGRCGDDWTSRFRGAADHWVELAGLSAAEAAERIRRDRLSLLVDLSGHFGTGSPAILAARPAPIQVGLSLYPATLGLPAVGHRITDSVADPPGSSDAFYTEELARLDRVFCCYSPPDESPPAGPLPAAASGTVTFGVFSRPAKIARRMLVLWAEILRRVPRSRLLFHYSFNGARVVQPEFTEPLRQFFRIRGCDPDRLEFVGLVTPHERHLALHQRVDVMLDTFPFTGLTTTCESLWMGVPVVTLAGRCRLSRAGASLLSSIGLDDWVAATPADYVRIATAAAADLPALGKLRGRLRGATQQSPLTDQAGYVRAVEEVYLSLIQRTRTV